MAIIHARHYRGNDYVELQQSAETSFVAVVMLDGVQWCADSTKGWIPLADSDGNCEVEYTEKDAFDSGIDFLKRNSAGTKADVYVDTEGRANTVEVEYGGDKYTLTQDGRWMTNEDMLESGAFAEEIGYTGAVDKAHEFVKQKNAWRKTNPEMRKLKSKLLR